MAAARRPSLAAALAFLGGLAVLSAAAPSPAAAQDAPPVRLLAAGSLRAALTEAVAAYARAPDGGPVEAAFGPSGLLRGRIEQALAHADRALLVARGGVLAYGPPREAITRDTLRAAYGVAAEVLDVAGGRWVVVPAG